MGLIFRGLLTPDQTARPWPVTQPVTTDCQPHSLASGELHVHRSAGTAYLDRKLPLREMLPALLGLLRHTRCVLLGESAPDRARLLWSQV
jgi:hypothetical protein